MKSLSIVLPCYNPAAGWEKHLLDAYAIIREKIPQEIEVIVVNDGSTQPPAEAIIDKIKKEIPHFIYTGYEVNRGKGAALRYGVEKASGDKIIYTDIDFPYESDSFLKIWEILDNQDIVVGIKNDHYYDQVPRFRVFISKALRKLIGILFRIPITDTQCGLKGFNQKGKEVFLQTYTDRYLCDLEFIYLAFRKTPKLNIQAQEVQLRPNVVFSTMKPTILVHEVFNLFRILLKGRH